MKRVLIILITMFLAGFSAVAAPSVDSKQKERDQLMTSISQLESLIRSDNAKVKDAQKELTLTAEKIKLQTKLIGAIDKDIYRLNNEIAVTRKEIAELQARLDTLQQAYNRLVLAAYKNRDTNLWYEFVISSESLSQAFRRYAYFRNITAAIQSQASQIRDAQAEIAIQESRLSKQLSAVASQKDARAKEYKALQNDKARYSKTVATASKNAQANRKKMAAQTARLQKLNAEIDKMLRSDVAKQSQNKVDPVTAELNKRFSDNAGKLPWPMNGYIIGHFHEAFDAYNHKVKREPRNGILIAGHPGSTVHAVFEGEVTMFGRLSNGSYGVVIRHGSFRTFYCGLETVCVSKGQVVKTGQEIGTIRTVDSKSDLEFIVYYNNSYINPERYLRK